jgi:peptidoglycan/LPS O-acetylase OafA/YrhL
VAASDKPVVAFHRRVAALDGLRGLAILWVLLHQLCVLSATGWDERLMLWPAQFGWVGVTIFFVLSGYLITDVLLDTRDAPNRWSSFYARRALRILPLYLLVVAIVFGISIATGGAFGVEKLTTGQAASFWLLLGNWSMAEAGDYLVGPLAVTWSVAIEEQFYLVWPLVVWLLRSHRAVGVVCGVVLVASVAMRLYGLSAGWNPIALYVLTPTRIDAIALGSLAAIAVRSGFNPLRWRVALWATLLVAGLAAALGDLFSSLAASLKGDDITTWSLGPGLTFEAMAAAALLLLLTQRDAAPWVSRCFEARWLRSFGRYSYGIYLTHSPVRAVIRDYVYGPGLDGATPWIVFPEVAGSRLPALIVYMAVCIPLCWLAGVLSYRLVERPCLSLKSHFTAQTGPAQAHLAP